jgi:hypothetical protein
VAHEDSGAGRGGSGCLGVGFPPAGGVFFEPLHPVGHHPAEFLVKHFAKHFVKHFAKSYLIHSEWIGAGPGRQCRPGIAGGRDQLQYQ